MMFRIENLETVVSISATEEAYKKVIGLYSNLGFKKYQDGMTGYDMRDFLNYVLPEELSGQVHMDPESGGFSCYIYPEGDEVTEKELEKAQKWVDRVSIIFTETMDEVEGKFKEVTEKILELWPNLLGGQ